MGADRQDTGMETLAQAGQLLRAGRAFDAKSLLESRFAVQPWTSEARLLLAQALARLSDVANAEAALRTGLKRDKGHEGLSVALADLLAARGQTAAAEKELRAALMVNRRASPIAIRLAELLVADRRAAEALQVTTPLIAAATPHYGVLAQHATTLKALHRGGEAVAVHRRAAKMYASSAVAHHNLASTLATRRSLPTLKSAPFKPSERAATRLRPGWSTPVP